jgi:hypothetical protein
MATQLLLLESTSPNWKLDRRTREIGRRGVAEARAALRRANGGGGSGGGGTGRTKAA